MKKIVKLTLATLLTLTLVSCGKSQEVKKLEENISTIGEVTLDKEEMILSAEQTYASLEEKDKEEVENYELLLSAREEFDNIGKDYSDEDKLKARATIALQNVVENDETLVVQGRALNTEEIEFVEIVTAVEKIEGEVSEVIEQTFVITEDDNVIIDIVTEDETKILDVLHDYETGLFVITEPLSDKLELAENLFVTDEDELDRVELLIERYSATKDKEFIGLDEQMITKFDEKAKKITLKKEQVELIKSIQEKMKQIRTAIDDGNKLFQEKKYDLAKSKYEEVLVLATDFKNIDLAGISTELDELKNKIAELLESTCNNLFRTLEATKDKDAIGMLVSGQTAIGHLEDAMNNYNKLIKLYDDEFKGKF